MNPLYIYINGKDLHLVPPKLFRRGLVVDGRPQQHRGGFVQRVARGDVEANHALDKIGVPS